MIQNQKYSDPENTQHLFVDNWHVWKLDDITRTLHVMERFERNPVLRPEKPWECPRVLLHGSVIYDDDEKIFIIKVR